MPFQFRHRRTVQFAETDLAGIVHFANFFRYMEEAEHAFYRSLGFSVHNMVGGEGEEPVGWPRVHASCDFKRPARYNDVLTIRVSLEEIRTRSVRYGFQFFIDLEQPPVARGTITAVCVSFEGDEIAAVPIPDAVRRDLEAARDASVTG